MKEKFYIAQCPLFKLIVTKTYVPFLINILNCVSSFHKKLETQYDGPNEISETSITYTCWGVNYCSQSAII